MTLLISRHQGWKRMLSAVLALQMIVQCVSAVEPETCYSRQHQRAIVNVRQALTKEGVLMDARVVRSERDCVLACCSEEVKQGAKCNMAVFNGKKEPGDDNCFLFHCPAEQDCPLMKAADGINTYDIYKGLIHLTAGRPSATMGMTSTSTPTPRTTQTPPTTTTTTSTTTQTPTTTPPPTTTTQSPTTPALDVEPLPHLIFISPIPAVASTTTTTTTEVTSITIRKPNKPSKKQNKSTKKGKLHPVITKTTPAPASATTTLHVNLVDQEDAYRTADKPQPKVELCTTTTASSTTTTLSTTTTTTTTTPSPTTTTTSTTSTTTTTTATPTTASPPTTSTATVPPTTYPTTKEKFNLITTTPAVSLLIVPKGVVQPEHPLQDQSQAKAATMGRGAVKSGVVAFMVLGLAVLTMALAIGGRKAMESFDRRHYTRLELNDLHYEV